MPSLAFVPFLLTGDRYYADEMMFWADYAMLRTYNGEPFLFERHMDRLRASAQMILLDVPFSDEEFMRRSLETMQAAGLRRGRGTEVQRYGWSESAPRTRAARNRHACTGVEAGGGAGWRAARARVARAERRHRWYSGTARGDPAALFTSGGHRGAGREIG